MKFPPPITIAISKPSFITLLISSAKNLSTFVLIPKPSSPANASPENFIKILFSILFIGGLFKMVFYHILF
jgi:hypothetical protein